MNIVEKIKVQNNLIEGDIYLVFTDKMFFFDYVPKLSRFFDNPNATTNGEELHKWTYINSEKVYRSKLFYRKGLTEIYIELSTRNWGDYIKFQFGKLEWSIGNNIIYCNNCGNQLLPSSKFCSNCGNKISSTHGEINFRKNLLIPSKELLIDLEDRISYAFFYNSYIRLSVNEDYFKYDIHLNQETLLKIVDNLRILDQK